MKAARFHVLGYIYRKILAFLALNMAFYVILRSVMGHNYYISFAD